MGKRTTRTAPPGEPAVREREKMERAAPPSRPGALENEIRLRAYYRYLEREEDSGDATTDWLEAESDVLGRRATGVDAEEKVLDNGR